MRKTIALLVTSVTGNTMKLADAVEADLKENGYQTIRLENTRTVHERVEADLYLVFFWCRKSTLNDVSRKSADMYNGKQMAALGTMGSYPTGEYGDLVRHNVAGEIGRQNECLGVYLSQGAIKAERTEMRRALPKDAPHYLDDEGYKRHLESRKHPDQKDLDGAVAFVKKLLREQGERSA